MRAFLLVMLAVIVGCDDLHTTSSVANTPKASELDVVVSCLAQRYEDCVKSNIPLIIEDTCSIDMLYSNESHDQFTKSLVLQASKEVPADLIRDFCAKNSQPHTVWPDLRKHLNVMLISREEKKALFSKPLGEKPDGWDRFYAKYPKSPGIITISRVGFNRAGDVAMVYIGSQSHWLAGRGQIYVLRKRGGAWEESPAYIGPSWVS